MKKIKLYDTICPVSFDLSQDRIVYFDKLNKHEGVFCYQEDNKKIFLKEVFDSFGIVRGNKLIYYNLLDGKTNIFINDLQDEYNLLLDGIFFDFKFDNDDNFCCLGSNEEYSIIQIYNKNFKKLRDIYITDLLFCSSFEVIGEYIYVAGFDKDNLFKILKINYFGRTLEVYNLNYMSNKDIIANFLFIEDYTVLHVTGKTDKILIYNLKNGSNKIIQQWNLGLDSMADIKLIDDMIAILDKNTIYKFDVDELFKEYGKIDIKFNSDILKYKYLLYSTALKNNLILDLSLAMITSILIPLALKVPFNLKLLFSLFGISYFLVSNINNFVRLKRKSTRIEVLLNLFKRQTYLTITPFAFFLYFTSITIVFLKPDWRILIPFTVVALGDFSICKTMKDKNIEYSVELLEYNNEGLRLYIKDRIEELLDSKSENIEINIIVKQMNKDYIKNWKRSREAILFNGFVYKINENKIIAQIDFNKRDIKYSRYSILMDLITFIKENYSIDEIKIHPIMIKNREKS